MEKLRQQFGGACQAQKLWPTEECKVTEALEFAHLEPTGLWGRGRGLPQRVHDIVNNPTHYILVCRPHHVKQEKMLQNGSKPSGVSVEREPGSDDD
jgi:hypothetical protein